MSRISVINSRVASRGAMVRGTATDVVNSAADTTSNVVTALGVGFGVYLLLQYVVPKLFGAATETKRSVRGYREAGGGASVAHVAHVEQRPMKVYANRDRKTIDVDDTLVVT